MFRGFTRHEHWLAIGLIVTLCAASIVYHLRSESEVSDRVLLGPVTDHPDGQLVLHAEELTGHRGDPSLSDSLVDGRVDVNRAPAELLADALPGIGPARSEAIVEHRERLGGFSQVEDMEAVPGIGPATVERLRPLVAFGEYDGPTPVANQHPAATGGILPPTAPAESQPSTPININTASEEELQELTGVGPALSQRIVEDRRLRGPFHRVDDLTRVSGIGPATLENNRARLTVY